MYPDLEAIVEYRASLDECLIEVSVAGASLPAL
jgi:hypothetical protein